MPSALPGLLLVPALLRRDLPGALTIPVAEAAKPRRVQVSGGELAVRVDDLGTLPPRLADDLAYLDARVRQPLDERLERRRLEADVHTARLRRGAGVRLVEREADAVGKPRFPPVGIVPVLLERDPEQVAVEAHGPLEVADVEINDVDSRNRDGEIVPWLSAAN